MEFLDLKKDFMFYEPNISKKIFEVCKSGKYLFGEETKKFEKDVANIFNVKNSVAVANATDALILVLLNTYSPGMKVVCPNFGAYPTSVAILNVVVREDLYYCDVNRQMIIDFNKIQNIKNGIIFYVSLYGNNLNELEKLREMCNVNNNILIEDAAQSFGSRDASSVDYKIFSFFPTKPLNVPGDGGMIISNHNLDKIRSLAFYGQDGRESVKYSFGMNSRMSEINCAITNIKLKKVNDLNEQRRKIAKRYNNIIKGIAWHKDSVYHQYVTLWNNRDFIIEQLNKSEIPYMIHYSYHVSELPVLQGKYNDVGYRVNDKILSLPVHPFLEENDIQKIEEFLYKHKEYEYLE